MKNLLLINLQIKTIIQSMTTLLICSYCPTSIDTRTMKIMYVWKSKEDAKIYRSMEEALKELQKTKNENIYSRQLSTNERPRTGT